MLLAILKKEFILILRDKHALAALFIMPVIFILIMSLVLQNVMNGNSQLTYHIKNLSSSPSAKMLVNSLSDNKKIKLITNEENQFNITIPKTFNFESSDLNSNQLIIIEKKELPPQMLNIFKGNLFQSYMQTKINFLKLKLPDDQMSIIKKMEVTPSEVFKIKKLSLNKTKPNSTQQSVPAWMVFAIFFIVIPMSTIFLLEKKQNTLLRLYTMNVSIFKFFLGKIIPYMLINQIQVILMLLVGVFIVPIFGPNSLHISLLELPSLILMSISVSFSAVGISILVAVLVKSIEQATVIGGALNILMGAIGGVMVPVFVMPTFMQKISIISPMHWGLNGFVNIFTGNGNIMQIIFPAFILMLFGLIFLLISLCNIKYKLRSGS
jgi:ABC-2 type transport system permease protein